MSDLLSKIVRSGDKNAARLYSDVEAKELEEQMINVKIGFNHWSIYSVKFQDWSEEPIEKPFDRPEKPEEHAPSPFKARTPSPKRASPRETVNERFLSLIRKYGAKDLSDDDWADMGEEANDYTDEDLDVLQLLIEGKAEEALATPDALYHAIKYHYAITGALSDHWGIVGGEVYTRDTSHVTSENVLHIVPFLRSLMAAEEIQEYPSEEDLLALLGHNRNNPHSSIGRKSVV